MRYLSRKKVNKTIAASLLLVLFAETLLPAHVLAAATSVQYPVWEKHYYDDRIFSSDPFEHRAPARVDRESITAKEEAPLIGGPGQPEMSSFQSVNADNVVDLFTGDFSYNIPLLDVGGYPVNIHYSGGPAMDQEASWVGLGWNINPGTVNRSPRGMPDDFNGEDKLKRIQSIKENKTIGISSGVGLELFGGPLNLSINTGVFNNTYNGWGVEYGINANINSGSGAKGSMTASLGLSNNSQTGLNVSPSLSMSLADKGNEFQGSTTIGTNFNSRTGLSGLQFSTQISATVNSSGTKPDKSPYNLQGTTGSRSVQSSFISFATPAYSPSIQMPYTSTNFTFNAKYGPEAWGAFGSLNLSGYVSSQKIAPEDTLQSLPAFGYLYYTKAKDSANALLDLSREKEIYFNYKSTPHIAIPQYTYDIYSISGEGTGGMFRPYRSEAGYMRDHHMKTKSASDNFAINIGGGAYFKAGVDYNDTDAFTENKAWKSDITPNLEFREADTTFQPVYFRNPGEKTSNTIAYYNSIGGDSTVRIGLQGVNGNKTVKAINSLVAYSNKRAVKNIAVTAPLVKQQRDKRTQVITYKTNEDVTLHGLDTGYIHSYKENRIPLGACPDTTYDSVKRVDNNVRKLHHIGEITVLNADGRRYIYGLPAYNVEQSDVTFSIDKESEIAKIDKGQADYVAEKDNHAVTNKKGKENFFTKDIMPAYAHSFLLTGLISADYVDITGDGITDDDLGDAVKFNYTMLYGRNNDHFRWRTPNTKNQVSYSEGLKSYNRDDKGTYMYGKKEIWYLNSIASKTMIAVFRLSDKREDGLGILDENGGVDASKKLRRIERIDLYSKPDLIKNGANARPVKSVHFEYDYSLCRNTENNTGNPVDKNGNTVSSGSGSNVNKNKGKLTLKKIWFSYNGNYKGVKNPYTFTYGQVESGAPENKYNPEHNSKNYDRWGSYKNSSANPSSMNNIDYPFTVQDSTKAAENANAWQLTNIKLPSGGVMKVSYEADDYGYVQNKRAMQLFKVAGFGSSPSSGPVNLLYNLSGGDNEYLFIDVTTPVYDKADIKRKYLDGIDKLYCKIAVEMPENKWGKGHELVPTYIEIDNNEYGFVPGNNNRIWIKLAKVDGKQPVTLAALQFLKLNLPSKAYPGSETGEGLSFKSAVEMLVSSLGEINNVVKGFYDAGKKRSWCQKAVLDYSFVRLNTPVYKKYGGGYRVKRVEVFDNWNAMTAQKEASYGQNYIYTDKKVIARDTVISGVRKVVQDTLEISSGVATYEPFIGGEENPFREPMEYEERISVLAPKNYMYSERPLGESYFPGPMVGYGKVRVRTIHTKAKSANGWQETEFFTSKDFPTLVDFTSLDGDSKKRYNPQLRKLLQLNAVSNITISQGFKVELNDMSGKMKAQANYAETDPAHPIHYTRNFYKVDDYTATQQKLNNNVWVVDSLNGHVNTSGIIGLDIELMNDMREQYSKTHSKNHQANLDMIPVLWFTLPIITYFPMFQKEENTFHSVATVKIVQRYGILDSVLVVDKGSVVTTKNLVYDAETGDAVVSRTNNEFDDPIYQFNYPAHWAYSGMGAAYRNIETVIKNKLVIKGKMLQTDETDYNAKRFFESGDEIWLDAYQDEETVITRVGDCPKYNFGGDCKSGKKIWAIDAEKGRQKNKGIYFIDENGVPFHALIHSMRIIRSGKRNMLGASVGNIVSMASPIKEVSANVFRLVIDSTINVINTAATVYKDLWQVEKTFYVKDSVVRVYQDFGPVELQPKVYLSRYDRWGGGQVDENQIYENSGFVTTSMDFLAKCSGLISRSSKTMKTKSLLTFDFGDIPTDAIITDAKISFSPKLPVNFWRPNKVKKDCSGQSKHGYYWPAADSYYKGTYSSRLRLITSAWKTGKWPYDNVKSTTTHEVIVGKDMGHYTNLTCTDLIQDYIASSTRFGLVFELNKTAETDNDENEVNFLSFGGENGYNSAGSAVNCDPKTPTDPVNCNSLAPKPTLTFSYRTYVDSAIKLCKENISDTATNPYRWGILGNWRADRAYTWYSDRKESDAADTTTNIRVEGVLKNYTSYWGFSDTGLVTIADTTKWVWNAASATYNKRGFEIENYDPLGRYNAGLYGYNQSLPVAVAQNSRYREVLYDGFEDYNFRNEACVGLCEKPREFDFVKDQSGVSLDTTQSHTGKYSLKVNAGSTSQWAAKVSLADSMGAALSIGVDSTPVYSAKRVIGAGTGLLGNYQQNTYGGVPNMYCTAGNVNYTRSETNMAQQWGYAPPIPGLCGDGYYSVSWLGKIQAKTTGEYTIYLTSTGGTASMFVNGVPVSSYADNGYMYVTLPMVEGQLYIIGVFYNHIPLQPFGLKLEWYSSSLNLDPAQFPGNRQVIPSQFLYPLSVVTPPPNSFENIISKYCINLDTVKPENVIREKFSPVQKKKVVVSGWLRMDGDDCFTAPVLTDALKVVCKQSGGTIIKTEYLEKTGIRIEGWQRYEKIMDVPDNAAEFIISLSGTQSKTIFVDDLRVQPYNSSMKSFAYDAVSLRLMAELDENNYASFYEYDNDGTLIRVKKETVKGIQTIKETRSALIRE